jgi:hypothetical protein
MLASKLNQDREIISNTLMNVLKFSLKLIYLYFAMKHFLRFMKMFHFPPLIVLVIGMIISFYITKMLSTI